MQRRRFVRSAVMVAVALQVVGTGVLGAQTATGVNSVEATVSGSVISVTGSATFVETPTVVGTDPAGDATVPGIGSDVTQLTISRPAGTNNLVFTMDIADAIPVLFGVPETILYTWGLNVDTAGASSEYSVQAWRTAQYDRPGGLDPVIRVLSHPAAGSFDVVGYFSGTMADGKVTATVPRSSINADTGTVLSVGSRGVGTTAGAIGFAYFNNNLGGDGAFIEEYTVPGPTVRLGIAPAGTPPELVPLTVSATVNVTTGAFNGFLPKPAGSGEYVVAAEACYHADACGSGSTTVTVS